MAPALTDLNQQWGGLKTRGAATFCNVHHTHQTRYKGHCGSGFIFIITILFMLNSRSLIVGCRVFRMRAFATTPRAPLIEIISSCATRQDPLREIRLLSTVANQGHVRAWTFRGQFPTHMLSLSNSRAGGCLSGSNWPLCRC